MSERKYFSFQVFFLVLLLLGFFLAAPGVIQAATIYANSATGNDTTGDGSSGSPYKTFHKAYTAASADDTINLTGTFTWTDADETGDASTSGYTIGKDLTITGQSADTTIVQAHASEASADRRVFSISLGVTATIENLTIRHGMSGSSDGGGIHIDGTATIDSCLIYDNRAASGSGGGVNVRGAATVQNSTIYNNIAHYKGGGLNRNYYSGSGGAPGASDTLDIINSTITGNQVTQTVAYLEGGGVFFRRGSGSITNSTITGNQVVNGGTSRSTHGIGTDDPGSVVSLKNNIIAGNTLSTNGGDIGHRSASRGTFTDNGNNIIGRPGYYSDGWSAATTTWMDSTAYNTAVDGTYVLQDGSLDSGSLYLDAALATNSTTNGTTTFALTDAASIAIDNGATGTNGSVSVPSVDQRGLARSGNTDIGAYEYGAVAVSSSNAGKAIRRAPLCQAAVTPHTIERGQSATLSWRPTSSLTGSYYVNLPDLDTSFPASVTSVSVTPTESTRYQVEFVNSRGANFCWAEVTVTDPVVVPEEPDVTETEAEQTSEETVEVSEPVTAEEQAEETKPAKPFFEFWTRTLRRGNYGQDVTWLQRLLAFFLGRDITVDGRFGSQTEQAVVEFQEQRELAVDGVVGAETRTELFRDELDELDENDDLAFQTLYPQDTGDEVIKLQELLNIFLTNDVAIDGSFGVRTEIAVKSFQTARGLKPDGIVGLKTWEALLQQ